MKRMAVVFYAALCGLAITGPIITGPISATSPPVTAIPPSTLRGLVSPVLMNSDTIAHPPTSAASANYSIDWYSLNGGGLIDASSTNFKEGMSVGQSVAGEATSPSYRLGIGFWYGTCSCPCHGDPKCDGVTDVLDVVEVVSRAFRGAAAKTNPECPREWCDVDCTGTADVLDVVKIVNVAFRGADKATEFCNPCGP